MAPAIISAPCLAASSMIFTSRPGLVRKCTPARKQDCATSRSSTVPAPTKISGAFCTRSEITSIAPGTVMVISTNGDSAFGHRVRGKTRFFRGGSANRGDDADFQEFGGDFLFVHRKRILRFGA